MFRNSLVLTFLLLSLIYAHGKELTVIMKQSYGTIVPFKKESALYFPDFGLIYKGQRFQKTNNAQCVFTFEQFELIDLNGNKLEDIEWSSGTGEIAPTTFKKSGKKYWLELRTSNVVGNIFTIMKIDELIVRPMPNELFRNHSDQSKANIYRGLITENIGLENRCFIDSLNSKEFYWIDYSKKMTIENKKTISTSMTKINENTIAVEVIFKGEKQKDGKFGHLNQYKHRIIIDCLLGIRQIEMAK